MIAALLIDMQNAFFETPELRDRQQSVTSYCNQIIDAAHETGTFVLLVKTEHEEDRSTWTLNMLEDDQGFIFRGSTQAEFVPGLVVEGLPHLLKTRDSAFLGTYLLLRLRNWGADTVVLAGVSTHNCIAQTGRTRSATTCTSSIRPRQRLPRTKRTPLPCRTFSAASTAKRCSQNRQIKDLMNDQHKDQARLSRPPGMK